MSPYTITCILPFTVYLKLHKIRLRCGLKLDNYLFLVTATVKKQKKVIANWWSSKNGIFDTYVWMFQNNESKMLVVLFNRKETNLILTFFYKRTLLGRKPNNLFNGIRHGGEHIAPTEIFFLFLVGASGILRKWNFQMIPKIYFQIFCI